MLDNIKSELEILRKAQREKLDLLGQLKSKVVRTESEIHQLTGAIAVCEKLLVTESENARLESE